MSYFPSDIPYMTDNELEEHGINVKTERGMKQDLGKPAKDFDEIIESMRETVQKKVDDAYQRGYNVGIIASSFVDKSDEAYQRGLDDAWEVARKIALGLNDGGFSTHYLKEVFGSISFQYAFKNYSASEAIEKLKAYEEKTGRRFDIDKILEVMKE